MLWNKSDFTIDEKGNPVPNDYRLGSDFDKRKQYGKCYIYWKLIVILNHSHKYIVVVNNIANTNSYVNF